MISAPTRAHDVLRRHLRLVRATDDGSPDENGDKLYAVLGPVPLPLSLKDGGTAVFSWTTFVRVDERLLGELKLEGPDLPVEPERLQALLKRLSKTKEWPQCILTYGDFVENQAPLVRLHSNCLTGDIFGSQRCECGPQLTGALAQIVNRGSGAMIYMADHEGRGIGLFAKAAAYLLQDEGFDTYEANLALGYGEDERDFSDAAFILNHLRGAHRPVRLLSNNPAKKAALSAVNIPVAEMVPHIIGVTDNNVRYLTSKRKFGHVLPEDLVNLRDFSLPAEAS